MRMHTNAVLIFGTFNPVTNAHVNLGIKSRETVDDSDVIFIPAKDDFIRDWKGYDKESIINNRLDLLQGVAKDNEFLICDAEITGTVDGKSINTIEYIKSKYGYKNIYFCMGTDKIGELHKWYKAKQLVEENYFLVFTRGEALADVMDDFTSAHSERFIEVKEDETFFDISSTRVRQALKDGEIDSIKDMVPEKVYKYFKGENNEF